MKQTPREQEYPPLTQLGKPESAWRIHITPVHHLGSSHSTHPGRCPKALATIVLVCRRLSSHDQCQIQSKNSTTTVSRRAEYSPEMKNWELASRFTMKPLRRHANSQNKHQSYINYKISYSINFSLSNQIINIIIYTKIYHISTHLKLKLYKIRK